jgi:hypothetical protein
MIGAVVWVDFRQLEIQERRRLRWQTIGGFEEESFAEAILVELVKRVCVGFEKKNDDRKNDKHSQIEPIGQGRRHQLRHLGLFIQARRQIPIGDEQQHGKDKAGANEGDPGQNS